MQQCEYLAIKADMISTKFIEHYKPQKYIVNGYINAVVKKTMYGLPQADKISH